MLFPCMPLLEYLSRGRPSIPRNPIMMVPKANTRKIWQRETLLLNSSFFLCPFWSTLGVTVRRVQGKQAQCRERGQVGRFSPEHYLEGGTWEFAPSPRRRPTLACLKFERAKLGTKVSQFLLLGRCCPLFLTGGCSAARS